MEIIKEWMQMTVPIYVGIVLILIIFLAEILIEKIRRHMKAKRLAERIDKILEEVERDITLALSAYGNTPYPGSVDQREILAKTLREKGLTEEEGGSRHNPSPPK